ncbi:hypothetical protein TNIN_405301 [Trichonephila inaurata madagascariensis]|uniref:Uncharacterized protein n=1 Tax=Trichonephila inaurata madagascariensis TaxID=2747483 RepID=A0A8X7C1F8_9ARAC|nr:hypothetical protein TNIN_405301 [Trichonephila inaurata madagascariensis]
MAKHPSTGNRDDSDLSPCLLSSLITQDCYLGSASSKESPPVNRSPLMFADGQSSSGRTKEILFSTPTPSFRNRGSDSCGYLSKTFPTSRDCESAAISKVSARTK